MFCAKCRKFAVVLKTGVCKNCGHQNPPQYYMEVTELEHNYTYKIRARNGRVGVWNDKTGEFILNRKKFGDRFTFGEIHWDLSDHFGTARPLEELEKCPLDVTDYDENAMLKYLKGWEDKMDFQHPKEPYNGQN